MKYNFRTLTLIATSLSIFGLSSCSLERLFPGRVADGIARLTVNNLAKLILALNALPSADDRPECDLRNPFSGEPKLIKGENGHGSVVYQFENCSYDFKETGTELESESSCGAQKTSFFGKVTVSGQRTVSGILTDNKSLPIIPSGPGAIEFTFDKVTFENYRVKSDTQSYAMTNNSGSVAFNIKIHLGKNREEGFCMVPLPNPTLSQIRYSPGADAAESIVTLPGPAGDFQATIDRSDFQAQVGMLIPENEGDKIAINLLKGSLTVWGNKINVPSDNSFRLEPKENNEEATHAFSTSLSCMDELELSNNNHCSFEKEAAVGVAQLTINNIGKLLQAITKNPGHFPSSPPSQACYFGQLENPTKIPNQGVSGDVVWEFRNCVFDFGNNGTNISLNNIPSQEPSRFFGKVTLSGRRSLFGRLTGNKANPVIPEKPAMFFSFDDIAFDNFRVHTPGLDKELALSSGNLSVDLTVHLEKEGEFGIYKTPLSNITIDRLKFLQETKVILTNQKGKFQGDFHLSVSGSDIHAQNKRFKEEENIISGFMNMFGTRLAIEKQKLDPFYERDPNTDKDGHESNDLNLLDGYLADSAARLSILNAGNLIAAIAQNDFAAVDRRRECGLGKFQNITSDQNPKSRSDNQSTIESSFTNCIYDFGFSGTPFLIRGKKINLFGRVTLTGKSIVVGKLTGNKEQPVIPQSGNIVFDIKEAQFENFKVLGAEPKYALTITKGKASFKVTIHLAINPETKLYSEPLGNLTFESFKYAQDTKLIISVLEGEFVGDHHLPSVESDFNAQVETHGRSTNTISGTFTVFGNKINIPSDGKGLDPNESTNPNDTNFQETHVHDSLEQFQALMVARLLIRNLGTIASEANSESLKSNWWPSCGFASKLVQTAPKRVEGRPGSKGLMQFEINNCEAINQRREDTIVDPCSYKVRTHIIGKVIVSGTQTVTGEREKRLGWFDSIIPRDPRAATFDFSSIEPTNFSSFPVYSSDPTEFEGKLILESGSFSAKVFPVAAASKSARFTCKYDQPTPVSRFHIKAVRDLKADLYLLHKGSPFYSYDSLVINSANFKAQNGIYKGEGNYLDGYIEINGSRFEFSKRTDVLLMDYDQEQFDAEYSCRLNTNDENSIHQMIRPDPEWDPLKDCPKLTE